MDVPVAIFIPGGPQEQPEPSIPTTSSLPNWGYIPDLPSTANLPCIEICPLTAKTATSKLWADIPYNHFQDTVSKLYDEVVFYRRNLFKIPSGKGGKEFIKELTHWLHQFNVSSRLNAVALKTFMILPSILLQKPSAKSKAKQHQECLQRRLACWRSGDIPKLMQEVRKIQSAFKKSGGKQRKPEDTARTFAKLIMEGKISAAIKLLEQDGSSGGLLKLTDEVMEKLKEKHPEPADVEEHSLHAGPVHQVPDALFESIDEQTVLKAALNTRGSAGPSGMDADAYRRILVSKNFNLEGKALREEVALLARNLSTKSYHPDLLESYVASRLIPLDKLPGERPIGVGEVLRRIIGKMVVRNATEEIKEAAGPLQTCAGQGAGAEAAIHSMRTIFEDDEMEAVLLIDAENAFNSLNRSVALHNIRIQCPLISNYLINTYRDPSRLII
jgi:hypothetical protein